MIDARRSPVDGMWRAWGEFKASQLGLLSPEDRAQGAPDLPRQVCLAVAKTKWGAIHEALKVAKKLTPKEATTPNT